VKTTGTMVSASPRPATIAFSRKENPKASWSHVAITISAKNPSTTDGMPARSSMVGFSTSRSRRGANSEVKSAAATPIGVATAIATRVTFKVPTNSGIIEYFGTLLTGCQTKPGGLPSRTICGRNMRPRSTSCRTSGSVKRGSVSRATKTKMRTTAAMPVRATTVMPASMSPSRICRRRMGGRERRAAPWVPTSSKDCTAPDLATSRRRPVAGV
jgi:hypothetical protein